MREYRKGGGGGPYSGDSLWEQERSYKVGCDSIIEEECRGDCDPHGFLALTVYVQYSMAVILAREKGFVINLTGTMSRLCEVVYLAMRGRVTGALPTRGGAKAREEHAVHWMVAMAGTGGDMLPPGVMGVPDEMLPGLAAAGGRAMAIAARLTQWKRKQRFLGELPQIAPDDKRPCQ